MSHGHGKRHKKPGQSPEAHNAEAHADGDAKKIHIDFYGSDLLRARVPKVFDVAEAVATDWVNDGRFEGLPLGNPVAQMAAQVSLRKAKDLEKRVDKTLQDKGVYSMARMGVELAKSKLRK